MAPPTTFKKQRSQDRELRQQVREERRRAAIEARSRGLTEALEVQEETQAQSRQLVSTKYARRDVEHLKSVFDAYDTDASGTIEKAELLQALQKQKRQAQHFDGTKKSLEERRAHHGAFLVDFAESMFKALDANRDRHVSFDELLQLMYPYASDAELATMLSWVAPPPERKLDEYALTDNQRREICSMFRLYDKDRNGTISLSEFREAMRRCGLDAAETAAFFAEADTDGNRRVDLDEFTEFMRRQLFSGEELTFEMLYGPI